MEMGTSRRPAAMTRANFSKSFIREPHYSRGLQIQPAPDSLLRRRTGYGAVHDVFLKVLIFGQGAHGFAHGVGAELERPLRRPGLRVGLGIVKGHIDLQDAVTRAPDALD